MLSTLAQRTQIAVVPFKSARIMNASLLARAAVTIVQVMGLVASMILIRVILCRAVLSLSLLVLRSASALSATEEMVANTLNWI